MIPALAAAFIIGLVIGVVLTISLLENHESRPPYS